MRRAKLVISCVMILFVVGGCRREIDLNVEVAVQNASKHNISDLRIGDTVVAESIPAGETLHVKLYSVGKPPVTFTADDKEFKTTVFFRERAIIDWVPTKIWIDEDFAVHVEGKVP